MSLFIVIPMLLLAAVGGSVLIVTSIELVEKERSAPNKAIKWAVIFAPYVMLLTIGYGLLA